MRELATASGQDLGGVFQRAMEGHGVEVSTALGERLGPALAFAFDHEAQTTDGISVGPDTFWRITTSLSGQILTLDFSTMQVTSAYPLTVSLVDVLPARPGHDYQRKVAEMMMPLWQSLDPGGAFPAAVHGLRSVGVRPSARCRVRVVVGELDSAVTSLARRRFGADDSALRQHLASLFSRAWITTARQPLLPFSESQVTGGSMRARFSDSEVYELQIPEAHFEIVLGPVNLRRRTLVANSLKRIDRTSLLFGVTVRSAGPVGIVRASGVFTAAVLDTLPMTMVDMDSWPAAEGLIESFVSGLAAAARSGDRRWLREHARDPQGDNSHITLPEWLLQCAP